MARAEKDGVIGADSSAGHLALGLNDRADADFAFSMKPRRTLAAFSVSSLLQAAILVALYFTGRVGLEVIGVLPTPESRCMSIWSTCSSPAPVAAAGVVATECRSRRGAPKPKGRVITVPAALTPTFEAKVEQPPLAQVTIPIQSMSQGLQDSLGAVQPIGPFTTSRGPGSGDGAGSGRGPGIGRGDWSRARSRKGRGTGDGVDDRVAARQSHVTVRVAPKTTTEAMVAMYRDRCGWPCIVRPNGTCTDARVTRAPDPPYGLDRAALEAVGRWRFVPGKKGTQSVSVPVSIQLDFSVR